MQKDDQVDVASFARCSGIVECVPRRARPPVGCQDGGNFVLVLYCAETMFALCVRQRDACGLWFKQALQSSELTSHRFKSLFYQLRFFFHNLFYTSPFIRLAQLRFIYCYQSFYHMPFTEFFFVQIFICDLHNSITPFKKQLNMQSRNRN